MTRTGWKTINQIDDVRWTYRRVSFFHCHKWRECISWKNYAFPQQCNQCPSPLKLWVRIRSWRGVLDTILFNTVCQWLVAGRQFSPVSSTNKTDRHYITEILLNISLTLTHWWWTLITLVVVNPTTIRSRPQRRLFECDCKLNDVQFKKKHINIHTLWVPGTLWLMNCLLMSSEQQGG
jgi:hypothetical protein